MQRLRILLADDHEAVRRSVARLLDSEFDVVATVADGQSLVEAAVAIAPDVIVVDVSMPVVDGIEAVRRLKRRRCSSKIVFLSIHSEPTLVDETLDTGALGYVLKSRAAEELASAIHAASQGRTYVSAVLRERD